MHNQKSNPKKKEPPPLEIFFDARKANYWLKLPERFLNLDSRNVKLHLRRNQFQIDVADDYGLKVGDRVLTNAQLERCCDYAGPLAGHKQGLIENGARKILVTSEAEPVEPKKGSHDFFDDFLIQLLPPDSQGHAQAIRFLYWLKIAWECLRKNDFRASQMIVLAGPSGCGKSLLQSVITAFLGGRMAKPYRYMTGATNFNADLGKAEHLVIADETARPDIRSRRELGAKIKDMCVNAEMSLHEKGCEAVTVSTYRRVSMSCNDEPENLMILPPLDDSVLDKLMLFKCAPASVGSDRVKIWDSLMSDLPGLAWELERLRIPKELHDPRYLVKPYWNPEIMEIVTGLSPEMRLLSLVDEILFADRKVKDDEGPWIGGSIELEQTLRMSPFAFAVDGLLHYPTACGVYLQRLATKFPDRFEKKTKRGKTLWTIRKESADI